MTFKSLLHFGSFGKNPTPAVDRFHSAPSDYGHYEHGWSHGSHKGKGGSGAALSALTLLAFLFLINVMQQSLDTNNGTTTTVFLREGDGPVVSARGDQAATKIIPDDSLLDKKYVPIKTSLQIVRNEN